jgi:hypothetical protein
MSYSGQGHALFKINKFIVFFAIPNTSLATFTPKLDGGILSG